MDGARVVVAEILKPRGNRGELSARSQTDVPGRLESLRQASVRLADGSDRPVELEEAWPHKGDWVLKFAGVDSVNDADAFRGSELWVPPSERGVLPEGSLFESDLVGCSVLDAVSSERLGAVEGLEQYGGPSLLVVTVKGKQVLIPFVPEICRVDVPGRAIRVTLPDGLMEL